MKSVFKWLVSLSLPLMLVTGYANPSTPTANECQPVKDLGNLTGLIISSQQGDDPKDLFSMKFCFDKIALTAEHISVLEEMQKKLMLQLATQSQPININSNISLLSSSDLPPISIISSAAKTYEDEQGVIHTDAIIPQYRKEIPATKDHVNISLDWAGVMVKSRMVKTELWQRLVNAMMAGKPITTDVLKGQSIILDAYKDMNMEMMMPKLSLVLGNQLNLLVEGLNFKAFYQDIMSLNHMDLIIPTMRVGGENIQFKFSDLNLKTVVQSTVSGLNIANVNLGIKQILLENKGVQLNQLTLKSHGEEVGDTVNGFIETKLQELVLPETFFGETHRFDYQGNFVLRHLDVQSLKKLQDKLYELQRQQYSNKPISEEMMGMVIIGQLMQALPKLWAKSPEFAIDHLQVNMGNSQLIGKGFIRIDGNKPLSINDLSKLKLALEAKAEVVIDKAILKILLDPENEKFDDAIEAEIDELVKQNQLLAIDKDRYQITLSLQSGNLLVNGQKIDWAF